MLDFFSVFSMMFIACCMSHWFGMVCERGRWTAHAGTSIPVVVRGKKYVVRLVDEVNKNT